MGLIRPIVSKVVGLMARHYKNETKDGSKGAGKIAKYRQPVME
jgi:hypothetical protein